MSTKSRHITKPLPVLLARALFDNKAEFPNELSFNRGDVVSVLERNPKGYAGWWICSYKGKLGIAPGNRLEVLGVVKRKNEDSEADVYDDPAEWLTGTQNRPNSSESQPPMQTLETDVRLSPRCICPELSPRKNRVSGLTDSGNYSNRSSDVSLGIQSSAGFLDGKSTSQPSGSQYGDYEELDLSSHEDNASEQPPMPSKSYGLQHELLRKVVDQSTSVEMLQRLELSSTHLKSVEDCTQLKLQHSNVKLLHPIPLTFRPDKFERLSSESECLSLQSDDSAGSFGATEPVNFTDSVSNECSFIGLSSETDYLSVVQQLQQRIRTATHLLHQSLCRSSPFATSSQPSPQKPTKSSLPREMVRQFSEDLDLLTRFCTTIVAIAKQTPDPGLVRKFHAVKKTLDHNIPPLNRILEEISTPENRSHLEKTPLIAKLERLLRLITQAMSVFETTVLTNASLLFKPSQASSPIRSNQPCSNMESTLSIDGTARLPQTRLAASNSSYSLDSNADLSHSMVCLDSTEQLSELVRLIPNTHLEELHSHCEHALNISQDFVERIIVSKTGPSSSNTSSETFTSKTINNLVNETLIACTELIKTVSAFCSLLSALSDTFTDNTCVLAWQKELTTKNDSLCEALKGLITQAKEVSSHLQKGKEGPPLPGPVLQRLIGAGHTVRFSVRAIQSCADRVIKPIQTD